MIEVVGSNWAEVVKDPSKDAFVMLFAPWGGHLEALVPEWYKIAAHFKDNEEFVTVKMDFTANEVKGLRVSGLPTIVLFTKDNKEGRGVPYYEKRTFEKMLEWLEEKSPVVKSLKHKKKVEEDTEHIEL